MLIVLSKLPFVIIKSSTVKELSFAVGFRKPVWFFPNFTRKTKVFPTVVSDQTVLDTKKKPAN